MKTFESVERIIDSLIRKNGGLTLSVKKEYGNVTVDIFEPPEGYQVGYLPIEENTYTDCIGKLQRWIDKMGNTKHQIGFWLDNGTLYVDESEHMLSCVEALKAGKERKELAVWDWSTMSELAVK